MAFDKANVSRFFRPSPVDDTGLTDLSDLYAHTCPVCGGLAVPDLADAGPWDEVLNKISEELFSKKINEGSIPPDLYRKTADKLMHAVHEGLGGATFSFDDKRNDYFAHFQQNIHAFSAAKSLNQMRHFTMMMAGEEKGLRSFESFRNKVLNAGYEFNVVHLQTEYNTAVAGAQMAKQWADFEKNGVDILQYSTAGDNKVRPEHAKLNGFTAKRTDRIWKTIYPPNAWNCRCTVIPGITANIGSISIDRSGNNWKQNNYNISPYFQKNTGETKLIFDEKIVRKMEGEEKKQLQAKDYNLPSYTALKNNYQFPKAIETLSKADAEAWWRRFCFNKPFVDIKDKTGATIRLDEAFAQKIIDTRNRFNIIENIEAIMSNPDEIWVNKEPKMNDKIRKSILKFFDDVPMVIEVNEELRVFTFHTLDTEQRVNQIRHGALVYAKK